MVLKTTTPTTAGPTSEPEHNPFCATRDNEPGPCDCTEPDREASPLTCQVWPDEYGPDDDHPRTELHHATVLAEHHEVGIKLAIDASLEAAAVVWDDARAQARSWLDSQGLEAEVRDYDRIELVHHNERNAAGEVCAVYTEQVRHVGVEWAVVVGQASSDGLGTTWDEIATRQHWTWSARWERWHTWFARMAAPRDLARWSDLPPEHGPAEFGPPRT